MNSVATTKKKQTFNTSTNEQNSAVFFVLSQLEARDSPVLHISGDKQGECFPLRVTLMIKLWEMLKFYLQTEQQQKRSPHSTF